MSRRQFSTYLTVRGQLHLIDGATPGDLQTLVMDTGLGIFWHHQPQRQLDALMAIAERSDSRIALIHTSGRVIIGYLTLLPPDANSRWANLPTVLEMGGIETSPPWRRMGTARKLLQMVFSDPALEEQIVIATAYSWCWDLETTGMTAREYSDILRELFEPVGFRMFNTDEPNIASYEANIFGARVGSLVTPEAYALFSARLARPNLPESPAPTSASRPVASKAAGGKV